eukprot:12429300-Karenia_brevis.AAC.1
MPVKERGRVGVANTPFDVASVIRWLRAVESANKFRDLPELYMNMVDAGEPGRGSSQQQRVTDGTLRIPNRWTLFRAMLKLDSAANLLMRWHFQQLSLAMKQGRSSTMFVVSPDSSPMVSGKEVTAHKSPSGHWPVTGT